MTEKHCARAAAAHFVPGAMNVEPLVGRFFTAANLVPHFGIENLRAAAGDGTETVFPQKLQGIEDRHLEDPLCEMPDFDRGECFDVQIRIESAQAVEQIEIPLFLQ